MIRHKLSILLISICFAFVVCGCSNPQNERQTSDTSAISTTSTTNSSATSTPPSVKPTTTTKAKSTVTAKQQNAQPIIPQDEQTNQVTPQIVEQPDVQTPQTTNKQVDELAIMRKEAQKTDLENKISETNNRIKTLQSQLSQNQNELSKANTQLSNAQNQKTNLVYVEGRGFVYMADPAKIKAAQDNVDFYTNLVNEYQNLISSAENSKTSYQNQLKIVEKELEQLRAS